MSSIKGRADDMLIIRGVNFFRTQVEDVIHKIKELSPSDRLIVERTGTMDTVKVKVEKTYQSQVSDENLDELLI